MEIILPTNDKYWQSWKSLMDQNQIQYPLFSLLGIKYQKEYHKNSSFLDLSLIIEEKGTPILGIVLSLRHTSKGAIELSGFGRPIFYLEEKNTSPQEIKGAQKILKRIIEKHFATYEITKVVYQDFLVDNCFSFVGNFLIGKGMKSDPSFIRIIDLSLAENIIKQSLRKSYKSLVNWGQKNFEIVILDKSNIKLKNIKLFRNLHIEVSGRETRSKKTWKIQYEMVKNGEAFVVMGLYENNLVTAALFLNSSKYCYYGVSASKRELFDKPISHAIIWNAILYAKKTGCLYFEMGEHLFSTTGNITPSKKELGISTFKKGFGGETFVRLNILLSQ